MITACYFVSSAINGEEGGRPSRLGAGAAPIAHARDGAPCASHLGMTAAPSNHGAPRNDGATLEHQLPGLPDQLRAEHAVLFLVHEAESALLIDVTGGDEHVIGP
jgi:hypothetical protein